MYPLLTFVGGFIAHLIYFRLTCGNASWLDKYLSQQEYFLGLSYGLTFGFMVFALLKFRENRKAALKAAVGSGGYAIFLLLACFFFGCCSSPMLLVYLNLFGLSVLKIPKAFMLVMTVVFVSIGYFWLTKKVCGVCCSGEEGSEKI